MDKVDKNSRKPPTPEQAACGLRMEKIAEERELDQAAVAEAIGVSPGMVSHYYRGRKPLTLKRLAAFCRLARCSHRDVDPDYIIESHLESLEQRVLDALRTADPSRREALVELFEGALLRKE